MSVEEAFSKVVGIKEKGRIRAGIYHLSENIHQHVEETNLSNGSIKISDGQLKFVQVKETQPLTFKYLEACLSEIIKNEEQVKKIIEYVKNKRESKYVPEIKRLYNN